MKSILVHLDASPRAAARLAVAQDLARQHGAELTALYGVLPSLLATPWLAGDGMAYAASMLADLDAEQAARARASFDQAARRGEIGWADGGSAPYASLLRQALTSDLVVLGQADASDDLTGGLPPDLVTSLITDSGKPTLVLPYIGQFEAAAADVLIAWKPTREAARAVAAALPWLRLAARVHVASRPEGDEDDSDRGAALEHWLRLHGVTAPIQPHRLGDGEVGEALLSLAADTGAGLLVMGCYGHGRAREWVLGGASRVVLASMTLPVLMVH
ncbi:MAG: universal stress protein [Burkholderiales bacterium]|nr:universal stress protein [Burkholderiales bacterium]